MNRPLQGSGEGKDVVPLFGNWRNAYVAVIVFFVVDVAAFYLFGRYFS